MSCECDFSGFYSCIKFNVQKEAGQVSSRQMERFMRRRKRDSFLHYKRVRTSFAASKKGIIKCMSTFRKHGRTRRGRWAPRKIGGRANWSGTSQPPDPAWKFVVLQAFRPFGARRK